MIGMPRSEGLQSLSLFSPLAVIESTNGTVCIQSLKRHFVDESISQRQFSRSPNLVQGLPGRPWSGTNCITSDRTGVIMDLTFVQLDDMLIDAQRLGS
jgi:hypothetical protein